MNSHCSETGDATVTLHCIVWYVNSCRIFNDSTSMNFLGNCNSYDFSHLQKVKRGGSEREPGGLSGPL